MSVGRQLLRLVGGAHGLAVLALLLALSVGLAIVLHWSTATIGALTMLGVVLRRVLTVIADRRDARATPYGDPHEYA